MTPRDYFLGFPAHFSVAIGFKVPAVDGYALQIVTCYVRVFQLVEGARVHF